MGTITDILAGIPLNAVLREKLTTLEKRLIHLETENTNLKQQLAKYEIDPGESCPMCRKPAFALTSSKPHMGMAELGISDYLFTCSACGFSDSVTEESAARAWQTARGH